MRGFLAVALLAAGTAGAAAQTVVSLACSSVGIEFDLCRSGAEAWAAATGNQVRLVSTPNDGSGRLALYQQLLAAQSGDIDVFQVDVVWPGILGRHFIDLHPFIDPAVLDRHFPVVVENDTLDGRLVAMPWFIDAGLLYYRKDLLDRYGRAVPATWQELTATARAVQEAERAAGDVRMWGFIWQGRAYEGLTCNALEWLDSFGGGMIVAADGGITVDNPRAVAALELAASWVGTITPYGVLNDAEEEARAVFQSGHAVFMRNWPYAWRLAEAPDSPVHGRVGAAPLPKGGPDGKTTAALGGQQLAVSRYSLHPELAADLVRHLTSREEQKRRAILGAFNPTIADLYQDPEVLAASPFLATLYDTFVHAVARPSRITGARYNAVSAAFWTAVHATLSGEGDAAANLGELRRRLLRLSRGGRW